MTGSVIAFEVLTAIIGGVVWVLALLAAAKRMQARSPRSQRQHLRNRLLWFSLPICVLVVGLATTNQHLGRHPVPTWAFLCMMLVPISVGLSFLHACRREYSDSEALANHTKDPLHCGRCEYDLTGNVSGICPECGWQIPDPANPPKHETPLTVWSAFDRIDYLDNWRKSLRQAAGSAAAFATLAIVMAVWILSPIVVVMSGFMCIACSVRTIRILAYRLRQTKDSKE